MHRAMTKVLFVISGLGAGGAERVISLISNHWLARGIEVEIASFDTPRDPVFHTFHADIGCHRLGRVDDRGDTAKSSKSQNLFALRGLLKKRQPDVVVSFLTKNNLLSLIAAFGTGIPVVCCERNNPERQAKHPAWNLLLSMLYRRAKLIICQTSAVRRCFTANVQDRLRVVPNPIKTWSFQRQLGTPPRIVAAGRLNEQKGFDLLVAAFSHIQHAAGEWRLDIFGEGPGRTALQSLISSLGLSERVKLMGNSTAPGAWIEHADLFVLSSRYEGFPNALGEAMAAGLPVIAADCDFGPAEMVEHMQSGLLVPPEDTGELGKAMLLCIEDEALRERLGKNAADTITRFAPPRILQQWDDVLAEALSSDAIKSAGAVHALKEPAA